jgi:hypothetical protein
MDVEESASWTDSTCPQILQATARSLAGCASAHAHPLPRRRHLCRGRRRYDMNGIFQMQGGKNLDFAEIDPCKPVFLGLSLAGYLVKPLLSSIGPNGESVATDSGKINLEQMSLLFFGKSAMM